MKAKRWVPVVLLVLGIVALTIVGAVGAYGASHSSKVSSVPRHLYINSPSCVWLGYPNRDTGTEVKLPKGYVVVGKQIVSVAPGSQLGDPGSIEVIKDGDFAAYEGTMTYAHKRNCAFDNDKQVVILKWINAAY